MATTIHDDLFAPDVIADPYGYFGRLRAEDPVHWNAKYEVWVLTCYDDIVWLIRHPSAVLVRGIQARPKTRVPTDPGGGCRDVWLRPGILRRLLHPARSAVTHRDADGDPQLFHAQGHGGLATDGPGRDQGPARRRRGERTDGRHAGLRHAAPGPGDRPDAGVARAGSPVHPGTRPEAPVHRAR